MENKIDKNIEKLMNTIENLSQNDKIKLVKC